MSVYERCVFAKRALSELEEAKNPIECEYEACSAVFGYRRFTNRDHFDGLPHPIAGVLMCEKVVIEIEKLVKLLARRHFDVPNEKQKEIEGKINALVELAEEMGINVEEFPNGKENGEEK